MRFLDLKYEAFGLDINDLSLKIVKLKNGHKDFRLVSFNEEKIAPGIIEGGVIKDEDALAKIIKSACSNVKGKKLKTKYVVASLPEEESFLEVIQMPKMTEEELKVAVPLEAENYIPLPIGEVYLDFQVIPQIKDYFDHLEVLIVAMPKKIVDSYYSCLKKAGLTPIIFEIESQAIARALVKKEAKPSLMVLIPLRENNTKFIIYSGSSIRFTATIPISPQTFTKAISRALDVDTEEAEKLKIEYGVAGGKNIKAERVLQAEKPILEDLTGQIKKYLNFYRDHSSYEYLLPVGKTEKILICGKGAGLKGLADFMAKSLKTTVEVGDPMTNFLTKKAGKMLKKDIISFTGAIGLALRQMVGNCKSDLYK